jgi:hypothetical protein
VVYLRDRAGLRIGRDPATDERRYVDDDEDAEKPLANALFESSRFVSTAYVDRVSQPESHKELKTCVYIMMIAKEKKGAKNFKTTEDVKSRSART